jgi:hypothetical protein
VRWSDQLKQYPASSASSRVTPLVSGYTNKTTKNCSPIIREKKTKGYPPEDAARSGKIPEMNAFMNQ